MKKMTENKEVQRWEGRREGETRLLSLMERMGVNQVQDYLHDTTGMRLFRAYAKYQIPDYGQTELNKETAATREKEHKEAEKLADLMVEDEDEDDTPQAPVRFEISNKEDLEKLRVFMKQHRRCKYIHHDVACACFTYSVTPTMLGPLYSLECSCGEKIILDGDMS